jgi:magnesium chelatase family protein
MQIFAPLNTEPVPLLQQVEVATFFQLPSFQIIGLPSPEVAEARERIHSAIEASGIKFPKKRVVLNLSPAHIRKRGTGLDLAMALAVLSNEFTSCHHRIAAWGELGLDGKIKAGGQLTRTLYAAWKGKISCLFLCPSEYEKAIRKLKWMKESQEFDSEPPALCSVGSLGDAWKVLTKLKKLKSSTDFIGSIPKTPPAGSPVSPEIQKKTSETHLLRLSPSFERLIGLAAAGHHHILLLGPRGAGKSHALEWLIALQPPLSAQQLLQQRMVSELGEISRAFSDELNEELECNSVPIRRISSQVRPGALIGNATSFWIRPGEFSLAHGGLLIADEVLEWARDSRELLREPLERRKITLTRAGGSVELPANFLLGANGNLCPCGGWPAHFPNSAVSEHQKGFLRCKCPDQIRQRYLAKLSGPILDRIDIVSMSMSLPPHDSTSADLGAEACLEKLQKKLVHARGLMKRNWGNLPGLLSGSELESLLKSNPEWASRISNLPFVSLRSRHKILRLALSLSAWDGFDKPTDAHFSEVACYRAERYFSSEFSG